MQKLKLGKIIGAVGLRGEVRVYPYTDYKEKFEEMPYVMTDRGIHYEIERVRYIKNTVIIKLKGVDDRNMSEALKEEYLYVFKKDAPPLELDSYYIHDLIGLRAENEDGKMLGHLSDVIQNSAQDIYEVETPEGKKILIPAVEEFIREIDLEKGKMRIKLIPGMME